MELVNLHCEENSPNDVSAHQAVGETAILEIVWYVFCRLWYVNICATCEYNIIYS